MSDNFDPFEAAAAAPTAEPAATEPQAFDPFAAGQAEPAAEPQAFDPFAATQDTEPEPFDAFAAAAPEPPGAGQARLNKALSKMESKLYEQFAESTGLEDGALGALLMGDLKGAAIKKMQAGGMDAAAAAAEVALTDTTAKEAAKEYIARKFGYKDYEQYENEPLWKNVLNAVNKRVEEANPIPNMGLAQRKAFEFAQRSTEGVARLGAKNVADVIIPEETLGRGGFKDPDFDENSPRFKAGIATWEAATGEKWVRAEELARLRIRDPEQWAKVHRRQMSTPWAVANEVGEIGAAIGGIIAGAGEDIGKSVNLLDDDGVRKILNAETGKFVVGTMLMDSMEGVEDPGKAMRERPLSFGLDLLVIPTTAVRGAAKFAYARKLMESTPGVKGYAQAATAMLPLPGTQLPGLGGAYRAVSAIPGNAEQIAREAVALQYAGALTRLEDSNAWVRAFTKHAPDAPDAAIDAIKGVRLNKASRLETAKRLESEMQDAIKADPASGATLGKMMADQPSGDEVLGIIKLHEQVLRHKDRVAADVLAGRKVSPEEMALLNTANNPKAIMELLSKSEDVDGLVGAGPRALARELAVVNSAIKEAREGKAVSEKLLKIKLSLDKHEQRMPYTRKRESRRGGPEAVAAANQRFETHKQKFLTELREAEAAGVNTVSPKFFSELQTKKAALETQLKKLQDLEQDLYSANSVKQHGAWLELDGAPLGGVNASFKALQEFQKADGNIAALADRLQVVGNNDALAGTLERALEVVKFLAEEDQMLVKGGLMTPSEAAAAFGLRWNNLANPLRQARVEVDAAAGISPFADMAKRSSAANKVRLRESVAQHLTPQDQLKDVIPVFTRGSSEQRKVFVDGELMNLFETKDGVKVVQLPGQTRELYNAAGFKRLGPDGKPLLNKAFKPDNQYGGLAGLRMELDTAEQVRRAIRASDSFLDKVASLWSTNKVVNSFSSHLNAMVGEGVVAASRGVDPLVDWPRALLLIAGKGDDAHKRLFKAANERFGITDGTSLQALDEIGFDAARLSDASVKSGKAFKYLSEELFNTDASRRSMKMETADAVSDGMWAGARVWVDDVMGLKGTMKKVWNLRDQMNRYSLWERAFKRTASVKLGVSEKELMSNPQLLNRALAGDDIGLKALELAHDAALDYKALPRGPRIPIGQHQYGLYEWMRKTMFAPFIAYGLKGTGFWTKEVVTRPLRTKAMLYGSQSAWQQITESERQQTLAGQQYGDRGWTVPVGDDHTIKTQFLQPMVNLPVDIARELSNKKVGFGFLSSLGEAVQGETATGRKIHNRVAHIISENLFSPTVSKAITGKLGTEEKGSITKLGLLPGQERLVDEKTGKEYEAEWEALRLFLNVKDSRVQRYKAQYDNAVARYESAMSKARRDYAGDTGRAGHNDLERRLREERRALLELNKDTAVLASVFESR